MKMSDYYSNNETTSGRMLVFILRKNQLFLIEINRWQLHELLTMHNSSDHQWAVEFGFVSPPHISINSNKYL